MQNFKEEFKDYSDILETEFSDLEDDFFSESVQFSDIENRFQSQHLIKNLQSTNNSTSNQTGMSPLLQETHSNVAEFKFKEVKLAKMWSFNKSRDNILRKKQKQTNNLYKKKVTTAIRKTPDEHSDSEDFCTPKKKRKKAEMQSDFTRTSVPLNSVNNETNKLSIVETPKSQSDMSVSSTQENQQYQEIESQKEMNIVDSQGTNNLSIVETPKSQSDMSVCSTQENQPNQKIENSQKEMKIVDSQESSISQNQISLNSSLSPKRIASSQESLGNKIMNISIDERTISNDISQSKTCIVIFPDTNSEYQQISAHEVVETSSINQNANSQELNTYYQQISISSTLQSKNVKQYPENEKFPKNIVSSACDNYCIKNDGRYNRTKSRCMWNIRKRELEVTKRENAVTIREKLLDVREAEIQKREAIIKSRDIKYLRYKSSKLTKVLKKKIKSKKMKKIGVLIDDTNTQFS